MAQWRKRSAVTDLPTGPREPRSTVLSAEDEAIVVAFRRHTLLPLDDCLYALQTTIPHLTRSSLHRCLQRHGIGRLAEIEGDRPTNKAFKAYPIGYFHIGITELRAKVTRRTAADFLRALIKAVPYKIHTVLTDNGTHFTDPRGETSSPTEIREIMERKEPF